MKISLLSIHKGMTLCLHFDLEKSDGILEKGGRMRGKGEWEPEERKCVLNTQILRNTKWAQAALPNNIGSRQVFTYYINSRLQSFQLKKWNIRKNCHENKNCKLPGSC